MSLKRKTKNKYTILPNYNTHWGVMSLIKLPSIDEWIIKM